jgi:DNA primase
MMRLAPEVIERVREATDIVAVVSEHVQLKRTGRVWKALCPFHTEKTPSFIVNPDRQIFKCFGCGEGGDVFRFLMEFEKLSFPETVDLLAGRAGIPLPKSRGWQPEEESVFPVLEWAGQIYRRELQGRGGQAARDYLKQRGLGTEVAERFGLGWAPPGWSHLAGASQGRYGPGLLKRAGLVVENDRGGVYDRFRGRLMIPIRSALGRTIGFGARTLGNEEPKYLNSPETEVFNKSRVLFGLAENREAIKEADDALVVEGYMDALALVQAGFPNVVAACGTAFTEDQAKILRRYVDRVVLLFDGDAPGVRAAWKSAGVFLGAGLDVRVVSLPPDHDPDSFVRAEGADTLRARCKDAPGVVGFAQEVLLDRVERREDLIGAFARLAAAVEDPIRRRVLLQEAAERFRFDEATLAREAERRRGPRRAPARATAPAPARRDPVGRLYLGHVLGGEGDPLSDLDPEAVLEEEELRRLYARWRELAGEGGDRARLHLIEDPEWRGLATELMAEEEAETPLADLEAYLRKRVGRRRGEELESAIREAEARGDGEGAQRLLRELSALKGVGHHGSYEAGR